MPTRGATMSWKARLKDARLEAKLNKTEFKNLVGVSAATVTDWEKSVESGGIERISGDNLTKACQVLGVRAEWLLNGTLPKLPWHGVEAPASLVAPEAGGGDRGLVRAEEIAKLVSLFGNCDVETRKAVLRLLEAGAGASN